MNEKDLERAAEYLKAHPEFMFAAYQKYLQLCEEAGEEPDDDTFGSLVLAATAEMMGTAEAMMNEVCTKDEVERLMREEVERLRDPETKIISGEELVDAVTKRLMRQSAQYFPRLHF